MADSTLELAPTNSPETTFTLDPFFVRLHAFGAIVFALSAVASVFLFLDSSLFAGLAVTALALWASAFCCKVVLQSRNNTIALGPAGARVADASRPVTWDEISDLRHRGFSQRLELLDRSGKNLLALEYQLTDIGFAFEQILQSSRYLEVKRSPRHRWQFVSVLQTFLQVTIGALLVASAVWGWYHPDFSRFLAILLLLVVLHAFFVDARDQIRSLTIDESGLTVKTALRATRRSWQEIEQVELYLDWLGGGHRAPRIAALEIDGSFTPLCPAGSEALEVFPHLELAHETARASTDTRSTEAT